MRGSFWRRWRGRTRKGSARHRAPQQARRADASERSGVERRRQGRRNATVFSAGFVGVVLLLLVFLGPGSFRVWSSQRSQTSELNTKIATLNRANARLSDRADQLKNPEAIRELARRDYGMAAKGAKAYAILPSPVPDDRPGGAWPFVELQPRAGDKPATGP